MPRFTSVHPELRGPPHPAGPRALRVTAAHAGNRGGWPGSGRSVSTASCSLWLPAKGSRNQAHGTCRAWGAVSPQVPVGGVWGCPREPRWPSPGAPPSPVTPDGAGVGRTLLTPPGGALLPRGSERTPFPTPVRTLAHLEAAPFCALCTAARECGDPELGEASSPGREVVADEGTPIPAGCGRHLSGACGCAPWTCRSASDPSALRTDLTTLTSWLPPLGFGGARPRVFLKKFRCVEPTPLPSAPRRTLPPGLALGFLTAGRGCPGAPLQQEGGAPVCSHRLSPVLRRAGGRALIFRTWSLSSELQVT